MLSALIPNRQPLTYIIHTLKNIFTIMRLLFFSLALTAATFAISAQTTREEIAATPEKAGGVYYAYPVVESLNTPAPKGYKPFYISHYGRHGSRYLISDDDYSKVVDFMAHAKEKGALTPLGEKVYADLLTIWDEARGRGGELSPLGARQHRAIARRMFAAYPEVFKGEPVMTARSTQVMRCAHSMFAFVEALKELNPKLIVPLESNKRNMDYLCFSTPDSWAFNDNKAEPWKLEYEKFSDDKVNPDRFVKQLFNDDEFILREVDPDNLMWGLFWIAVDIQNMETDADFLSLFDDEELFNLFEVINASFYIKNSSFPRSKGVNVDNAKNLLTNIVVTADEYIADESNGATLRFGHDGNIVPLAALMRFDGYYGYENNPYDIHKAWAAFKVSPMASNMQMIFFKNDKGDILVKFMMNECEVAIDTPTDIFPFYRWDDARAYLKNIIEPPSYQFCPADKR